MNEQYYSYRDFEVGSAAYVILHARERERDGLAPEVSYKGITNPKAALQQAIKDIAHVSPHGGDEISKVAKVMALRSTVFLIRVSSVFNDIQLIAEPGMTAEEIVQQYRDRMEQNSQKWRASLKGALARKESELRRQKDEERKRFVEKLMTDSDIEIEEGQEELWNKTVEANSHDGYGASGIRYAKSWALAMQSAIRENGSLTKDKAEELSHEVDYDGITGFQHSLAKSLLLRVWKYRSQLAEVYGVDLAAFDKPEPSDE